MAILKTLGRGALLLVLGVFPWFAEATVILQYHHISDDTPPSTSLSPRLFGQHMAYLEAQNFQVISLPAAIESLKKGQALPDKSVVITFDDSYDSVYREAFPILKKNRWPFTIFINTRPLQRKLAGFTTWEQLKEMAEHGATLANHSHTHTHFLRRLQNESEAQWEDRIRDEIIQAENIIQQHTGQNHQLLAYPYGEYDEKVLNIVADLGFVAFAQESGPLPKKLNSKKDLLALPRFPFGGIYGSLDDFKTKALTVAMPIKSIRLEDNNGDSLTDTVLPQDQDRPSLVINLERPLTSPIQCFASGQGAIEVTVKGNVVRTQAPKPLPVGRSRYNCTSATGESGRFYWYSQFFIRKQNNGQWYPEP